MLFSENDEFLEAAGYDHLDPGEDIIHPPWNPSEFQYAAFRRRDLELARTNVAHLASQCQPRTSETITNGIEPSYEELTDRQAKVYYNPKQTLRAYRGFNSVSVVVGGPEHEDCLHSLGTFGASQRPTTIQVSGVARPVRRPTAA